MNPKFYALLTLSLVATVTLPVVNGKLSSLVPAVIAQNTDARKAEAEQLLQLCRQNLKNNQAEAAIKSCQQAITAHQQIKDLSGEAKSAVNLGIAYISSGQYSQAISILERGAKIGQDSKERRVEALAFLNLGIAYYASEQPKRGIEFLQQALTIAKEIKDGELEKNIQQVLAEAEKPPASPQQKEADRLLEQGAQQYKISQFGEALQSWEQALQIYREIKNRQGEANSLGNLGIAYGSLGQYQKAIEFYQQSLTIAKEIGDRQGEANSLGNLGIAYSSLGQYQKAIEYHQQSLAIDREIKNRQGEAASLGNLGNAYSSLGQYQKAIEYLQQQLTIAKEIGDRQGEANSLGNLGIAYGSLGQYQKAIEYHQQSLAINREIGDRAGEALSLNNLGVAYRDNKQPAEAIKNLEASLNIYLDMRGGLLRDDRKDFLASNERTVNNLAEVLIQQNQPEKAFEWLNLATTADLADYNRLINAKVADPDAQKALDNWNTDNQQLEGMRRQLQDKYSEELAKDIRQFEEKVYKNAETIGDKYPEIAELFESKPTDITQLQKNIAPDTLVIQPVPLRDKVALFLVTREKLIVIQSDAKADDFNQLVSEYRTQLADYKNADYLVTGSKLYEILIRPIESQIATSSPKNIAIIATGQLRYIPFETLYDKKNDQVLLEKYPIYYLTRISTSTPPATERKPLQGLAFANPKPTQEELKGTEIEAETISKTFPGSEKYLGINATLDIFKKQAFRFSILHLGTHGCFDLAGCPNLGMQANTILFANNQQYNIADAALLGLKNTELITLSACQTAKEANADGQEISGLAYVLERAGAKSVIASLWDAEDNTSAEIMTQFYQNLKNGMTKSEAMRQAKLSQIKSHPYFWSPFILIGAAN
ncbi:tetratricopeptide repeat protein [Microcystis sp. LE19-55.1A]|uniref:CHAT domain-containing protein n=1 Tax=Microcystis sp. LE19-55.1A TaxID=3016436 RepID=UPI0022C7A6B8|nr:tetratricopeptide repeat protein [Microcystis sp. LE19-55.1A]MCZ8200503.1 tetratricopeptide repeat protein [Microcystis sp. LE19-55.1A]